MKKELVIKTLTILMWISVAVLLIFSYTRSSEVNETLFGEFQSFNVYEKISSKPLVYEVFFDGEDVGYLAFGDAYGYQSTIKVGTVISEDGLIIETGIVDQNETPSFIQKILNADFLKNEFSGESIEEGFSVDLNVSAVSGATVSSRAITKAVAEASQLVGHQYLGMKVPSHKQIKFGTMELVIIGMLLLALLSFKLKNKKLRYITLAYSILLLGFKYKQFIAYSWLVSLVMGDLPDFTDNVGWFILIIGTFLFIALTGTNVYCTYICPFGALQEAENRLAGFHFFKVSPKLKKRFKALPGLLAYISFVTVIVTDQMAAVSYEPFSLIFGRSGSGIQWVLLPLVLVMSLFVMRFYCNSVCPVGFVLTTTTKVRRKVVLWTKKLKKA